MTIANAYTRFFAPNPSYKNNNPPFTKGQNIFGRALQHWEEGAQHGENRSDAAKRIEDAWWIDDRIFKLDLLGMKLTSLPNCITGIDNLRELDLSGNSLEHLPDLSKLQTKEGKQCALQTLNLVGNPLSQLPDLRNIHSLQELHVTRDVLERMEAEQLLPPQRISVIVKEPSDIPLPPQRQIPSPPSQIHRRSVSASTPSLPNPVVKQSAAQEKNLNTPSQTLSEQIEEPKNSDAPTKTSIDEIFAEDEDVLGLDDNIPTQRAEPPRDRPLLNTQPTHADLKRELEEGRRGFGKKNAGLGNLKGREAIAHIRKHGTFGELFNQVTRSGLKGVANQFGRKKKMAEPVAGTANNNPLPPTPSDTDTNLTPTTAQPTSNNSQSSNLQGTPVFPISQNLNSGASVPPVIPKRQSSLANLSLASLDSQSQSLPSNVPSNSSPQRKKTVSQNTDSANFLRQQKAINNANAAASVANTDSYYPQGLSEHGRAVYDFFTKPNTSHSRDYPRSFNQMMAYENGVENIGGYSFETDHFYIQWLFPTDRQDENNPTAPVLNAEDIDILRRNKEVRGNLNKGFDRLLSFYGLKWDEPSKRVFIMSPVPATSQTAWSSNVDEHNNLRLTRIIRSMHLFGRTDKAVALLNCLGEIGRQIENRRPELSVALRNRQGRWKYQVQNPISSESVLDLTPVIENIAQPPIIVKASIPINEQNHLPNQARASLVNHSVVLEGILRKR